MNSFHTEQCDLCYTLRFDTYCNKCSRHLCSACNYGHACRDEAGLIAEKEKQKLSYKRDDRKDPFIAKYKCKDHNSEYNRFCGTCGVVLCQDCCANNHVEHEIESVPTASKKCAAIVRSLLQNLHHDTETAVKLVTDLQDIISESEKEKQIQDVKDLIQSLESTLVGAIIEKQKEEEQIVSDYIKKLEDCIKAWDKNRDKLNPVANEVNSIPFLLGFSDYVHDHENLDFPEAIDTNFLKHSRILHYEDLIEKRVAEFIEFVSSLTGIYAVSGITSRVPSPGSLSASANLSTSATTKIHKLFTKHPHKEEQVISEKYVKHLQNEIEEKHEENKNLQKKFAEMMEACENFKVYAKNLAESQSLTTEQKHFAKTDIFHQNIGEAAQVLHRLKEQIIDADVHQKSLLFQYEQLMEEKEDIRQRFIQMAGRTLSSVGSARSRDSEFDEQIMPKHIIEMFSNLYKVEWQETLDKLSISGKWQAHIVIQHLYLIVQTCFISCKHISAKQTQDMLSSLFVGEEDQLKHKAELTYALELKKKTATICAVNLQKMIVEKPEFQANLLKWEKKDYDLLSEIISSPYFNRCLYLSWLMVVQNPPMHMDEGPVRRSYIKRELYQEFTKKGSIVDYCVWPALYLEKDGPLGTKGIVQVY